MYVKELLDNPWCNIDITAAFLLICDKLTLSFNNLNGCYGHFCPDAEIAAYCD